MFSMLCLYAAAELQTQPSCHHRAHALLAYLEVEVPRLLGRTQVSLFARMRGVVKLPQGSKEQANEQVRSTVFSTGHPIHDCN